MLALLVVVRYAEITRAILLRPTSAHVIVWCGDTPVVLRSLDDRCERHKRASCAWSERRPASPNGRIESESEPRDPPQLQGVRGVARIAPSQLRFATIHHGLKVFVLIFCLVLVVLASQFRARMDLPKKKSRLESGIRLKSTRPTTPSAEVQPQGEFGGKLPPVRTNQLN